MSKNEKTLYLPLKKRWYEMIKSGEKGDEYREINAYWLSRFCHVKKHEALAILTSDSILCMRNDGKFIPVEQYINFLLEQNFDYKKVEFTLGYPAKDDDERRMKKGIKSIRTGEGKEEWGAKKGKKYFVLSLED